MPKRKPSRKLFHILNARSRIAKWQREQCEEDLDRTNDPRFNHEGAADLTRAFPLIDDE